MKSRLYGIIGAMDVEIEYIVSKLENGKKENRFGLVFYTGELGCNRLVVVKSGVGKVNAARCTQMLIDIYRPDYIINTGIAGALAPGLKVCDIVIADKLFEHDFNVTALGYARGYICTGEDSKTPTAFYPDKNLVARLKNAALENRYGSAVKIGTIASGDLFVSSTKTKSSIIEHFKADAAEMEGAAIGHTAQYSGVPFAVLRVMSDQADGNAHISMKELEIKASNISASIIEKLIFDSAE